jgi:hypothetical protein
VAFINPAYSPVEEAIWPSFSVKKFVLWERFYLRHDLEAHPRPQSSTCWRDYGGGLLALTREASLATSPPTTCAADGEKEEIR